VLCKNLRSSLKTVPRTVFLTLRSIPLLIALQYTKDAVRRLLHIGGDEGNRTPVRKVIIKTFYERITSFEIPLAGRRRAGFRFGYLFYLWPLQKKTGGAHLPLCHARDTAVVLREGTLAHSGSESYSIVVSVYI